MSMGKQLTARERKELARFRFADEDQGPGCSVKVADLLEPILFQEYFQLIAENTGASSPRSAGSIFMKRYAFLAVIYLYAMTAWSKQLNVSPGNLFLRAKEKNNLWMLDIYFENKETNPVLSDRAEWRKTALKHLFADNIFRVMEMAGRACKISKLILWENIAIYIFWLYETVFPEIMDMEIQERAAADFDYIVNHAPGSCFGNYHQNPIKKYSVPLEYQPETGQEIRARKTCCFSYEAESIGDYCKTCPHICRDKL